MRRAVAAVLLCTSTLLACSAERAGTPLGPEAEPAGAPELALYGIGDLHRAVPRACADPAYRQFDFWVGQWNIRNPAGAFNSTSVVTSELDGCIVMEDFINIGGFQGRSLSVYDARDRRWYQSFVDNVVGNYRISGSLEGEEMVMTGSQQVFSFATGTFRQRDSRIVWTPNADGTVRQVFVESFDGAPAITTFDGLYFAAATLDRADPAVFNICRQQLPGARHLDFWLGAWTVSAEPGPAAGRSTVAADLNDCLIEENFEGANGFRSRSFLFYDFVVDRWFHTYADNAGEHFELSGGLEDGRMVLLGDETGPGGRSLKIRLTLAPADGGGVAQVIELSRDGGETWREALSLAYRR